MNKSFDKTIIIKIRVDFVRYQCTVATETPFHGKKDELYDLVHVRKLVTPFFFPSSNYIFSSLGVGKAMLRLTSLMQKRLYSVMV
jgi:hypothetical protein